MIAQATAHSLDWVNRAVEILLESRDHPTIHKVLVEGLPLDAAVSFPEDGLPVVRCRRCNQLLASVPCAQCWINSSFVLFRNRTQADSLPDAPEFEVATSFLPGTVGKIAVMQTRIRLGYSAFCRGDARLSVPSVGD
jgi:hypothetical protein